MSSLDELDGLYNSELDESKDSSTLDEHIGYMPEFSKGDKVWDDLTGTETIIVQVLLRAYKLDVEYLEGMRFAWEVSKSKDNK